MNKLKKYDRCLEVLNIGISKYEESDKVPMKIAKLYFRGAKAYDMKKEYSIAIRWVRNSLKYSKEKSIKKYLKKLQKKETKAAYKNHYLKDNTTGS